MAAPRTKGETSVILDAELTLVVAATRKHVHRRRLMGQRSPLQAISLTTVEAGLQILVARLPDSEEHGCLHRVPSEAGGTVEDGDGPAASEHFHAVSVHERPSRIPGIWSSVHQSSTSRACRRIDSASEFARAFM